VITNLGDFLDHANATIRRYQGAEGLLGLIPEMKQSHVFYLDDIESVHDQLKDVTEDLHSEMETSIPFPFDDVSLIWKHDDRWNLARLLNDPPWYRELRTKTPVNVLSKDEGPQETLQHILAVHIATIEGGSMLVPVGMGYRGVAPNAFGKKQIWSQQNFSSKALDIVCSGDRQLAQHVMQNVGKASLQWLEYLTAISHPMHYHVRVTPRLSPKEERRVASGKERPLAKAPHFIVVDHEVLVGMRQKPETSHQSPIPHERRGHWMRLAERCRHARLLGKERVWVRPTFVGEPTWGDEKNLYEVLFDFKKSS